MIHWQIKSFEQLNNLHLYKILQLRINVFMLEQDCLYPECDDKDIYSYHLFGIDENEVIAYARLIPPSIAYTQASIGRVIVAKNHRGNQLGTQLMQRAIDKLENDYPSTDIKISAQAHLQKFYQNLGFKVNSEPYLEDNIPHIEMILYKK